MLIYADLSSFVCNLRIVLCHISRPKNGVGVKKLIDMVVSDKAIKSLYDHARPHSLTSTHSRNRQSPDARMKAFISVQEYASVLASASKCLQAIFSPWDFLSSVKDKFDSEL